MTEPDTFVAAMLAFFMTLELPFVLCKSQPTTVKTTRIVPPMTTCLTCGLHDLHQSRTDSQRDFRGVMRGSLMACTLRPSKFTLPQCCIVCQQHRQHKTVSPLISPGCSNTSDSDMVP